MASPLPPDPYIALGVAKDATSAAVKSAHRKLVLKCHPDKVADPAAKEAASDLFHKIQSAYEILIDEDRRARYDAEVRLLELRREAFERRSDSSRRTHDVRTGSAFPRSSRESSFKDSYHPRGPEIVTPQYEVRRPAYASAAEAADETPARATTRKEPELQRPSRKSGNDSKEKSKPSAYDLSKERQRMSRDEKKQRSQRETRRDRDRKYESFTEDASATDSDDYFRRPRRPHGEDPIALDRARQEFHEQGQRQEAAAAAPSSNYDERTRKMFSKQDDARDYIKQSRGYVEEERRPSSHRTGSSYKDKREYVVRNSDGRPQEVTRRPSARPRTDDRDAPQSRRRAMQDQDSDEPRPPPSLPKSMSSPYDIRIPSEKPRSQSWQDDMELPIRTQLKRAGTFNTSRHNDSTFTSKPKKRPTELSDGMPTPGPTPTYEASPTSKFVYNRQYADDNEYPTPDGFNISTEPYRTEIREPERNHRSKPSYARRIERSPSPMKEFREVRPRMPGPQYSASSQAMPSSFQKTSYFVPGPGQGVEQMDRSRQSSLHSSTSLREAGRYSSYSSTPQSPMSRSKYESYPSPGNISFSPTGRTEGLKVQSGYPYKTSGSERPAVNRAGSSKPVFVNS